MSQAPDLIMEPPSPGVIAGIRNNNVGINGIASNVKIMALRSTPRGDERDKDVAFEYNITQ